MTSQKKPLDADRTLTLLAEEFQVPMDEVAKLYEHERACLATDARVTSFVPIFAIRNVRDILLTRAIDQLAEPGVDRSQRWPAHRVQRRQDLLRRAR